MIRSITLPTGSILLSIFSISLNVQVYMETAGFSAINGRICSNRIESKKDGKDQESIKSSTTPDPGYHMGK